MALPTDSSHFPGLKGRLWIIILYFCPLHCGNLHAQRSQSSIVSAEDNGVSFGETNQNITVGPGDRAVLKCKVENLGTKKVTWRKQSDAHPLTIGLFTFVGDTRISVDFNQRTNEWSLIIQDVKPSDEGTYDCQISTNQEVLPSYHVKLNVKTVQVSGTDYVELGGQIQLMCNATGKPHPPHDVQWFKDGSKINSDAHTGILITKKIETKVLISVLVIKRSELDDNGYYVCRSSNRDAGIIKVHILNVAASNVKRGTSHLSSTSAAVASLRHVAWRYMMSLRGVPLSVLLLAAHAPQLTRPWAL